MLMLPPPFYIIVENYFLRSKNRKYLSLKLLILLDNSQHCKGGQAHGHDTNHGCHPLEGRRDVESFGRVKKGYYLYTGPSSELVNLLTLCVLWLKPLHLTHAPLLSHTVLAKAVLGGVLMHMLLTVLQVVLSPISTFTKT